MLQRFLSAALPLIFFTSIVSVIFFGDFNNLLQFRRVELLSGQLWRLFSAHFVHGTAIHLFWNGLGFFVFWLVFCRYLSLRYLGFAIVMISLCISATLLIFNSEVQWYQGFSGVLHGLFVLGALDDIQNKREGGYPLLLLLVFKILWEHLVDHNADAEWVGPVIVNAHLYGGIAGLLIFSGRCCLSTTTNHFV